MAVHLMTHSVYSLLSSVLPVEKLVVCAKEKGFTSIALTDDKSMFGVMPFIVACKKHHIKPIIGVTLECQIKDHNLPFVMLAHTLVGYKNLCALTSKINSDEFTLNIEDVVDHQQDTTIILLSEGGLFEQAMIDYDKHEIEKIIAMLNEYLDSFVVGLSLNEASYWKEKNSFLKEILKNNDIKTVALSKVLYDKEEDAQVLLTLQAIKKQKSVADPSLIQQNHRHMISAQQMSELYDHDDVTMTDEIANQVSEYSLKDLTTLPTYKNNQQTDNKTYLKQLAQVGFNKRYQHVSHKENHQKRLEFELDVICNMAYENYFLIVFDIIRFAKNQNIAVGPGRGSAAGSMVAYCLGITHVDPMVYGLLFERFLNVDRLSMPDIDIDFSDQRRDEIIDYVVNKYGKNHVAHIVTFGTLKAKMSLRDVGKVFDVNVKTMDRLIKTIPTSLNITLAQAFEQSSAFRKLISENKTLQEVFSMAQAIENFPRHVSTHAAGVVLSSVPLDQVVPLIQVEESILSTQYSMEYLENLGLIKMDFLGLRNLSIIDEVVSTIDDEIDVLKLPLDDKKTFSLIQQGDTVGIFQLESEGMKRLLVQMKCDSFDDIVATIALYRPGPMENIPLYLQAKHNNHQSFDVHPLLLPIVKDTYGILIYQEQILQAVKSIANFSLAKADILRKAISKKNQAQLTSLKRDFIEGAKQNKIDTQEAEVLFDMINKFANYGFNKSHAVAYALISYQMAYLKANYPLSFYCALLNGVLQSETKTIEYLMEAKRKNITVHSLSIETSGLKYRLHNNGILLPLSIIKGIGSSVVTSLVNERHKNGPFVDFFDFVARLSMYRVTSKNIESLIYAGACDQFKLKRLDMIATLDDALNYANLVKIENNDHVQIDLNLVSKPIMIHVKDQPSYLLEKEREVLGFYLSEHPLISIRQKINAPLTLLVNIKGQQAYQSCVMIDKIKAVKTKKGEWMAFILLSDESNTMDGILWPNLYNKVKETINKGDIVLVKGHVDQKQTFIVSSITPLTHLEVTP